MISNKLDTVGSFTNTISILDFLIDWSHRINQQKLSDHQSKVQTSPPTTTTSQSEENDRKYLLKEMSSTSDKHLSLFQHEDFSIDQQNDSEAKPSNYVKEQEYQQARTPRQFPHMHETATGLDDDDDLMKSNSHSHRCQNDNQSDSSYFSALREKLIRCDES